MRKISSSSRIYFALVPVLAMLGLMMLSCSTSSTEVNAVNLRVLVVSADNIPLVGAKVVSNTQPEGQLKVNGITGDNGKVTLYDIKTGVYEFYVSRFDYIQQEFSITLESDRTTETTITLIHE
jgi:Carboxypeptidase regulatory-like domain